MGGDDLKYALSSHSHIIYKFAGVPRLNHPRNPSVHIAPRWSFEKISPC